MNRSRMTKKPKYETFGDWKTTLTQLFSKFTTCEKSNRITLLQLSLSLTEAKANLQ